MRPGRVPEESRPSETNRDLEPLERLGAFGMKRVSRSHRKGERTRRSIDPRIRFEEGPLRSCERETSWNDAWTR